MNRHIEFVPRARKDLAAILKWLHVRSPRGAASWYQAFWDAVTRISADPDSFAVAEESHRLKRVARQALFKTRRGRLYRIIFEFSQTEVFILRVRRPGQRPLRRGDLPE
jgi:plasmid stabilization system protein ParE